MHLLPTHDEVIRVLRETGALREGHFVYNNGLHSNEFLQVPLAMRYYQHAKTFSVALSRLLRANPEIRAMISELSIVAPAVGGLPVAYGVCEALQAKRVYWAERESQNQPRRFRQFIEPLPGEAGRPGRRPAPHRREAVGNEGPARKLRRNCRRDRGRHLSAASQRTQLWRLPLLSLARLEASYYADAESCDLCKKGIPIQKVWV